MKINGSQLLIECLIEQGVDTIFGYPGGAVLNIYDALYQNSDRIKHILTSHEQGAAHAADGYARATGKVGVCMATSGPGATNLVTGIATAYMDSIPLVAITANVGVSLLGKDSFQEVDIAGVVMPITKHSFIVKNVHELVPKDKFNSVAVKQLASYMIILNHYFTECCNAKGDYRECVSRKRELFGKFIKALIDSHSLSREVLFYANELGVSCGYLNEVCNEVSNHSVKEIIDTAVATRLKYELSYTSKTIQELADEYNFPSQSYFCRYYKRVTGMTPSDFRKRRSED